MHTQINIEELLNLFKEKGYHITTKRETDMTRLVYDGIIVGTFSPDLYTYNDYDVINVGSMVEIRGFQRLYIDSYDTEVITRTVIDSILKYESKADDLKAKKNIIISKKMQSMTAKQCLDYLLDNGVISPYFTGYCSLPNGQICWGTTKGKLGVILVNSDNVFYFIRHGDVWGYLNRICTATAELHDLKECIDALYELPMKRTKKYWKFSWKTLIKYAAPWLKSFSVGNKKYFIKR